MNIPTETEIWEIEIDGWPVPNALFRLYVDYIRDAHAGINVFVNDLARTDAHSRILECCEGDTETFEEALRKAVESAIRDEND